MCLRKVLPVPQERLSGVGIKVFLLQPDGTLRTTMFKTLYEMNSTFIADSGPELVASSGEKYEALVHVYADFKDAKELDFHISKTHVKVYVRGSYEEATVWDEREIVVKRFTPTKVILRVEPSPDSTQTRIERVNSWEAFVLNCVISGGMRLIKEQIGVLLSTLEGRQGSIKFQAYREYLWNAQETYPG